MIVFLQVLICAGALGMIRHIERIACSDILELVGHAVPTYTAVCGSGKPDLCSAANSDAKTLACAA